jgi:hypothetical protein
MYAHVNKYIIKKMIPVETVPGIRGGGIKESNRGGQFKYDISDSF